MPIRIPLSRTVVNIQNDLSYITSLFDERTFQSPWSHPDVPVLVFADSQLPGFSVQNHGGVVGSGIPVELLFWGDWWNSPEGVAKRDFVVRRVQAILASDYFSELKQYGIDRPHWRGARVVTEPGPPASFNKKEDQTAVPDLIDALIDDDVFPDPDDEKIAFVVFMANGFTQSINENGGHTKDYNYEFPFDKDWFWVAWVRSFETKLGDSPEANETSRTFSHELAEMLSDPELDGWYAGGNPDGGEISDAAVSVTKSGKVKQTAWVNGALVQAYWSNQYGATVIPIDRDYRARILGNIRLERRTVVNGFFHPDPEDSRLCNLLPQCCLENRDYKFTIVERDEIVRLSVESQRYLQPQIVWTIEGKQVTKDVMLSLDLIAGTFEGRHAKFGPKTVAVQCKLSGTDLTLRTSGTKANFDVRVSCTVMDGSIVGNVKTNVIATPALTVGFVGAELTVDPEYERQRKECKKAAENMFKAANQPKSGKAGLGDPVEFGPAILASIPVYARVREYERARRVVDMVRMAHAVLPEQDAKLLMASLVSDVPALQGAIAAQFARKCGYREDRETPAEEGESSYSDPHSSARHCS